VDIVVRQLLAALALVGMALLGSGGSAAAHNELIGSDPADGATVASTPARVLLTFDLPVKPGFSTVTVTGPDRTQWQAGAPVEAGATVSMPVNPLGSAGQYTIAYQVLSVDGHPVRGAVKFTLGNPAAGIAAMPSPAEGSTEASPPVSSSAALWPLLGGGAVLLAAAVAVALRVGRSG
jgi:methionine-rich copper-binding protein CopC